MKISCLNTAGSSFFSDFLLNFVCFASCDETIASDCTYISSYPPVNFRQAVWFSHILNTFEDHINANSVGRLDQILYPFFKKDLEAGTITKEEAYELICCLWIKLYQYPDPYPADPRI